MTQTWREAIKQLAREHKLKTEDLLALTPAYDPFFTGSVADHRDAKWAKEILDWVMERWDERRKQLEAMGYQVGARPHLRAIHYLLFTAHPNPIRWDGKRYNASLKEWQYLCECYKKARVLGYIPFGFIEDHKHPEILKHLFRGHDQQLIAPNELNIEKEFTNEDITYTLPEFDVKWDLKLSTNFKKDIQSRIPIHLEIWTEKQREIVDLIGRKYFVNVQNATGQQSYENILLLLKRAIRDSKGKPIRIIYVSDYDPRGEMTIPIGVARILEYFIRNYDEFKDLDIKLKKLVLTKEQVIKYRLPPAPVKATESMKDRWMKMQGDYVVELDSIDVLFAPELVKIIEAELERYIPSKIIRDIEDYNKKVQGVIKGYNKKLEEKIVEAFKDANKELKRRIEPIIKDFKAEIKINMEDEYNKVKEILREWKEPNWSFDDGNDEEWLFDSKRDYIKQIKYYKSVRG